jgi:hypothetical protein
MVTVAGMGRDEGTAALRSAARWLVEIGRSPAVLDLSCTDEPTEREGQDGGLSPIGKRIPLARVPCGLDRLMGEPSEVLARLMEKLRSHETESDLLIVRIPVRYRMAVMRAAFLAGTLVIPIDETDAALDEAFRLSREVLESFLDLSLWPFSGNRAALGRYLGMMRDFLGVEPVPFDTDNLDLRTALEGLRPPPGEGYARALLAPDTPVLPAHVLHLDSMQV